MRLFAHGTDGTAWLPFLLAVVIAVIPALMEATAQEDEPEQADSEIG